MTVMPGLQEILDGLDVVEFVRRLKVEAAPHPVVWPQDVAGDLAEAECKWLVERGGNKQLQVCARQYAVVKYDGAWWAITRLHYRIHESEISLPAALRSELATAACSVGTAVACALSMRKPHHVYTIDASDSCRAAAG